MHQHTGSVYASHWLSALQQDLGGDAGSAQTPWRWGLWSQPRTGWFHCARHPQGPPAATEWASTRPEQLLSSRGVRFCLGHHFTEQEGTGPRAFRSVASLMGQRSPWGAASRPRLGLPGQCLTSRGGRDTTLTSAARPRSYQLCGRPGSAALAGEGLLGTRASSAAARPRACGSPLRTPRERLGLTTTSEPGRRTKRGSQMDHDRCRATTGLAGLPRAARPPNSRARPPFAGPYLPPGAAPPQPPAPRLLRLPRPAPPRSPCGEPRTGRGRAPAGGRPPPRRREAAATGAPLTPPATCRPPRSDTPDPPLCGIPPDDWPAAEGPLSSHWPVLPSVGRSRWARAQWLSRGGGGLRHLASPVSVCWGVSEPWGGKREGTGGKGRERGSGTPSSAVVVRWEARREQRQQVGAAI